MSKLYCGIDLHKNTSTICILKQFGEVVETTTLRSKRVVEYLANKDLTLIGVEASGGVNAIVQKLKDSGHQVKIINPNAFKAIGLGGKKTDKRDARALAEALRVNYIPEVYHKTQYCREIKSLLMGREQVVRTRVNLINHVRGILREYGITMPAGVDAFWSHISICLGELDCSSIRDSLRFLVEKAKELSQQEKEIEKRLQSFTAEDARIKQLQTIPGVGLMSALALVAVIDDISRFTSSKHFASYLGLVPREYSSGDRRRMGSITRSGSELLRRYLIHGARAVLMHTHDRNTKDRNRLWAYKMRQRTGMNKATVALAHRMARIAFGMLRDNKSYQVEMPLEIEEKEVA